MRSLFSLAVRSSNILSCVIIVIQLFAPAVSYPPPGVKAKLNVSNTVKLCQSYGCKVVAQVGTVKDAIEALDCGVDCIVAQGTEAGG